MRMFLLLFTACFSGCGEPSPEPLYLTEEFYEWSCEKGTEDYPVDRVVVSTETCDESVVWLISELHFVTGQHWKQRLYKDPTGCHWEATYPLVNADCDLVDGVTLTAWVEPATWSGALFGEEE